MREEDGEVTKRLKQVDRDGQLAERLASQQMLEKTKSNSKVEDSAKAKSASIPPKQSKEEKETEKALKLAAFRNSMFFSADSFGMPSSIGVDNTTGRAGSRVRQSEDDWAANIAQVAARLQQSQLTAQLAADRKDQIDRMDVDVFSTIKRITSRTV
jgi:hypothetical protein